MVIKPRLLLDSTVGVINSTVADDHQKFVTLTVTGELS